MINLNVETRDIKENNEELRKNGFIPAVFYGPKEKTTPIKIKEGDFIKAFEQGGWSAIISLKIEKDDHDCLIHDAQFDAVSGRPIHADFYVIEKGKKVEVDVPLKFVGVSPAEKTLGGILIKVMHEVSIKALPKDLPHEIEADITSLETFESQLKAKDIKLSQGVELDLDPESIIALVQEPKEEKEESAPIDLSSIEVVEKGKKEEEVTTEAK